MSSRKSTTSISSGKYLSKSSESLAKIDFKNDHSTSQAQNNSSSSSIKPTKMKKSQTALNGFDSKMVPSSTSNLNAASILRRRFSLFRMKRSQGLPTETTAPTTSMTDNGNVHALQQIIDQLRRDLKMKTDELETMRQRTEKKRSSIAVPSNESIEQAMQLQTMLNARLEEMLIENDLLKKSIQELESYAQQQQQNIDKKQIMRLFRRFRKTPSTVSSPVAHSSATTLPKAPNTPGNSSLTNLSLNESTTCPLIKSTNFIGSRSSEIRHKSEIEIEVKHEKSSSRSCKTPPKTVNISPSNHFPVAFRSNGSINKRTPNLVYDEPTPTSLQSYPLAKRRLLTNNISTQTPNFSPTIHPYEHHLQQQQLKALTDESLSKNEKIQAILRELNDCQTIIKQQEQQLMNNKKDRDQLCFIIDERTNELRNLKMKNEQLEQMIRNEEERSNDQKKLLSLLQESQDERDELLARQRENHERISKLEDQLKIAENDVNKLRDNALCSKIKLENKSEENERLNVDLNDMKKYSERLEQENHKLKVQIENERRKVEDLSRNKSQSDVEIQNFQEKLRQQRYENETRIASLDDSLKYSQKQHEALSENQRILERKHEKQVSDLKENVRQLEMKIEQIVKDKTVSSMRCAELHEENRRLEKALIDKEDDYEEKICAYREKNSLFSAQIEDLEKKLVEANKQLELVTIEKDETLADMLIAVRVASEMRHDAEDRLTKANDDLKRFTEHIEQEKAIHKQVQRRQLQFSSNGRNENSDCGPLRIKEIIRTLEENSRNNSLNNGNSIQHESPVRQRPLSQPCTRTELTNSQNLQFGTTNSISPSASSFNGSLRSITNEQYEEMKSIVEAAFARMPGTVCKRDALLKWCAEKLANYGILVTNFSNSWTDGIAFCSLLHSYMPDRIDLDAMKNENKKKRFEIAFAVAKSVGIVSILNVDEMCASEWPDWERVMYYVALIFRHFEGISTSQPSSPSIPIPQASSSPLSSPTFSTSSPSSSSSSSSSLCSSLRTSTSIPKTMCSTLQTV